MENRILTWAKNIQVFKPYIQQLATFIGLMTSNPGEAERQYREAVKITNDELVVNNPLHMLIELAYKKWRFEWKTIYHRDTLAVDSATAQKVQLFDVSKTSGEAVCNMNVANQMNSGEVFFLIGYSIDYADDLHGAEHQRVDRDAILKFLGNGDQIYHTARPFHIPGTFKRKRERIFAGDGTDATADVYKFERGNANPIFMNRFIKWGEDQRIAVELDIVGVTAQALAGDVEVALYGIYAANR